ncbi:unnamed protein product [Didymodactylos carnosus]|uniref:Phosphoinositide phospholipase C n=1 Tax=Didymodactylos carnosus TaxID=1234261 RepID=A0A814F3X7_9BILA|nr:unnamed protein product [Didymodactylos carnosus]CAF0977625.1 unnamed protein product [Didymodactylos carnosus]CAF3718332.1 unnamed protein product [Didymodactylos carnosus]CAF3750444.1 unnamed protein product [Didymodactylos carnosus]
MSMTGISLLSNDHHHSKIDDALLSSSNQSSSNNIDSDDSDKESRQLGPSVLTATTATIRENKQLNKKKAFFNDDNNNHDYDDEKISNEDSSLLNEFQKSNNINNSEHYQSFLTIPNQNNHLLNVSSSNSSMVILQQEQQSINEENQTSKPFKRKVVSFSSMPFEKKVADVCDCLRYMQAGSDLLKVRSYARQFRRFYKLSENLTTISWQPTAKKPSKAIINIDSIKEVRSGKTTDRLRECANQFQSECLFSIIYTNGSDECAELDLVASNPDEANIWTTGLSCLIQQGHNQSSPTDVRTLEDRQQMRDRWLRDAFQLGTPTTIENSLLDEDESIKLLMDYGIAEDKAKVRLQEIQQSKTDNNRRGYFSTEQLVQIFKELSTRPEIYHLLVRYSRNQDFLSLQDLTLFLEAEQGMAKVTKEKCWEIISEFEPSTEAKILGHLGIDGFTSYLLSSECDIYDPNHRTICQDMDQPLNHYFVASSHNTFLLADQLKGPSSIDGFIHALMRGCRCLEIHCYDGLDNNEPLIHNGTLTSKIPFGETIEMINNCAFETSSYPLILCIENNCSLPQQNRLAELLVNVFGDKLYVQNVNERLPSPNQLKGKVLIKSKKLPLDSNVTDYGEITDEDDCYEDHKRRTKKDNAVTQKRRKLSKAFSDLVTLLQSVPFEDFNSSFAKQRCDQLCTFSENAALRLATSNAEDFVSYNKRFLSRIQPGTWRVDSSNLNPQDFFNVGCQFVAMNYQTAGKFMDVYFGRFLSNGSCGYVLKPPYLRYDNNNCNNGAENITRSSSLYSSNIPRILHIKIISALHLPRPEQAEMKVNSVDPYVVVQIFGAPRDCDEIRTKTVYHNWDNPRFDESFEFEIAFPELTLVRFVVLDDESLDYDFIGQYTLPFECIQPGYRHVHLYTIGGELISNAYLFIHIVISSKTLAVKPRRTVSRYRRSLSRRKTRVAAFRPVNYKQIDELFKSIVQPLEVAFELRHNVEQSLIELNVSCGLPEISNVKQCIRKIASRLQKANLMENVKILNKTDIPILEYSGILPELSRQSVAALEEVIARCRTLLENGTVIYKKLTTVQTDLCEFNKDLPKLLDPNNLKTKKITKNIDNFSYDMALLQGQADLLSKAKEDANVTMRQILDAAEATHLLQY